MAPSFPGVREHEQICARLSLALQRTKLHHAMLFVGPRGVGKATTARGLACALHCERNSDPGCGTCRSCRRVLSGTHAGVEWIGPDTASDSISVDAVRELCIRVEAAPFEGHSHVVVIDPAEALGVRGANALLKTLEEPRPGVHFILIAQDTQRLLPTILSRCLLVRFGRLSDETVRAIVDESNPTDAIPRKATAVRLARGQAGLALELAADPTLDSLLELLRHAVAASQKGPAALFQGDQSPLWEAFRAASEAPKNQRAAKERSMVARIIDLWLLHLREGLRGRPGLADLPPEPWNDAQRIRACRILDDCRRRLDRNANVRLAFEHALLQLG